MKKLLLIITAFLFITFNSYPQTSWEKYEGNPVLSAGDPDSWEDEGVMGCSVVFDGEGYHMYYAGFDGAIYRIGHATSDDGIEWTRDPNNPVIDIGPPGSWEETGVYVPCVLIVNDTFHMWYDGAQGWTERIGHATSTDGSLWTKDPANPVMDIGTPGSWDDTQVFPMAGSVIFEDTIYKLWYGGCDESTVWQVGYATSPDGVIWTKDVANNPVIEPGDFGEWDDFGLIPGTVININDVYHIWFSGCTFDNRWRVSYATSTDGIDWTKDNIGPVLDYGPAGSWDFQQAWNASVIYESDAELYKMWYSGGDYLSGSIGYATGLDTRTDESTGVDNDFLHPYPNPSSGTAQLRYSIFDTRYSILKIYTSDGVMVKSLPIGKLPAGEYTLDLDLSDLPDGMYFIRMRAGLAVETTKLILLK